MDGSDYIATGELSTADAVVAVEGQTCEHVPAESLPWLLAQGYIVPVTHVEGGPDESAHVG